MGSTLLDILFNPLCLDKPTSFALGMFDGLHLGHQQVISAAVQQAKRTGLIPAVLLFDPHPAKVLHPESSLRLLTLQEEKLPFLAKLGVELTIILPFDQQMASCSPETFLRDVLVERLKAKHLSVGFNYTFGINKSGTSHFLQQNSSRWGYTVEVVPPLLIDGVVVSSSLIRQLVGQQGDMALAREFLGRPYTLKGKVVHGDKRGSRLGFPTANLSIDPLKLLPLDGVYAIRSLVGEDLYGGVMNIGILPTFYKNQEVSARVEVYLFDFNYSLYGQELEVEVIARIREERSFPSAEGLVVQIRQDISQAKEILGMQKNQIC